MGGSLELRSNWRVYLQEFESAALHLADRASANDASEEAAPSSVPSLCAERLRSRGVAMRSTLAAREGALVEELSPPRHGDDALTTFERKLSSAGDRLYRLRLPPWGR